MHLVSFVVKSKLDWEIMGAVFAIVLSLLAIFLILLVLVQRGRGGGLAGALGGMGGSSAFGAKAGDVFTRITIIVASIWIAFCLLALFWAKHRGDVLGTASPFSSSSTDTNPLTSRPMSPSGPAAPGGAKDAATTAARRSFRQSASGNNGRATSCGSDSDPPGGTTRRPVRRATRPTSTSRKVTIPPVNERVE